MIGIWTKLKRLYFCHFLCVCVIKIMMGSRREWYPLEDVRGHFESCLTRQTFLQYKFPFLLFYQFMCTNHVVEAKGKTYPPKIKTYFNKIKLPWHKHTPNIFMSKINNSGEHVVFLFLLIVPVNFHTNFHNWKKISKYIYYIYFEDLHLQKYFIVIIST